MSLRYKKAMQSGKNLRTKVLKSKVWSKKDRFADKAESKHNKNDI